MTENEAQRELARVAADLDSAIAQLVNRPAAADGWPASLAAASAVFVRIRSQVPVAVDRQTLRPLLTSIEQRVKRVNLLVESAALFYWGCVAVTRTQGAGYTHEGALEEFALGGRMQLEA